MVVQDLRPQRQLQRSLLQRRLRRLLQEAESQRRHLLAQHRPVAAEGGDEDWEGERDIRAHRVSLAVD